MSRLGEVLDTVWNGVVGATLAYAALAAATILIGGDAGCVACSLCPLVGPLGFALGIAASSRK
jgi:hypothetical protein